MRVFKVSLAASAAAALIASQPALAAPRTAAPTSEGEELAGYPGAGPVIAVIGIVGLISLLMLIDGDSDDDRPTSP